MTSLTAQDDCNIQLSKKNTDTPQEDWEAVNPMPCVICLENISEQAVALPCNHSNFDFLCLVTWLQQTSTCPLCKACIKTVEYRDEFARPRTYRIESERSEASSQVRNGPNHCSPSSPAQLPHWIQSSRASQRPHPRQSAQWRRRHRPLPQPSEDEILLRRKRIYDLNLYSLHVGSNRLSGYSDLTPARFAESPHLVSRARKWIRRELQVLEQPSALTIPSGQPNQPSQQSPPSVHQQRASSNAEFLLEYIVAILKTVDIKGSGGQAQQMLSEFLGEKSALFLHELNAWLRSPFEELAVWDRNVRYEWPDGEERALKRTTAVRTPEFDDDHQQQDITRNKRPRIDRWIPD